ncbi:MAG: hypothetical protein ACRDJW_01090 [Thermomicrobiales bacterium]
MRHFAVGAIAFFFVVAGALPVVVAAQDATPAASASLLAGIGYPELLITVTADAVDAPSEVAAGRYLVVLDNQSEGFVQADFTQLPAGVTLEEIAAADESEESDDGDDGDDADEEEDAPMDWYYEAILPGGASAFPGATGRAVVDLTAGEWFIDIFREPEHDAADPPMLTVTGEDGTPIDAPEPEGAVEIEMQDHSFVIPENLTAGPHIWKVTNTGAQPHTISISKGPDTLTQEQFLAIVESSMTGEAPPVDGPNPETDFEEIGGSAVLSAGQTTWIEVDLAPGAYGAVCWVPDQETGTPHMLLGMTAVFTVGEG